MYQKEISFHHARVPTTQGKQGTWPHRFPDRENTGNLAILQKKKKKKKEISFAQVVNSLILNIQDIAMFAVDFSNFS